MPHKTKSLPQRLKEQQIIIPDRPINEDHFDGAHSKIAKTIVHTLTNPNQDGISIGLEGVRGSGKSTIVNMVKRIVGDQNQDKNIALVTIDAWSHSGDHLRRACIENMAEKLDQKGWLNTDKWGLKLGNEAKPTKISTGIATLMATLIGLWLILPKEIQNEYGPSSVKAIGDLLPSLVWFWLVFLFMVTVIFKHQNIINFLKALTGKVSDIELDSASSQANDSSWRFQQWFEELTFEALRDNKRRLVIIFDNLDRISRDDAITTWKTLQIFFEKLYQNQTEREHLNRIFFINCYDKTQLTDDECEHFEKLIHTRVIVPPLTIDHWQTVAQQIFCARGFTNFEIKEIISCILKIEGRHSPSPRDMARCANEIRMLSYQHKGIPVNLLLFYWYELNYNVTDSTPSLPNIPANQCAFQELKSTKKTISFLQRLRQKNLRIPEENILGIPRTQAIETYAELYFSLPKNQALQALLHEPINEAFDDGDDKVLEKLSRQAVGYKTVLHFELEKSLSTYIDIRRLNKIIKALYASNQTIEAHEECIDIFAHFLPLVQSNLNHDLLEVKEIANNYHLLIEKLSSHPKIQQEIIASFSKFSFDKDSAYYASPEAWVAFMCCMDSLLDNAKKAYFKPVLQEEKADIFKAILDLHSMCLKNINQMNKFVAAITLPSVNQFIHQDWEKTGNDAVFWFLVQKNAFEPERIVGFLEDLLEEGKGATSTVPLLLSQFAKGSTAERIIDEYFIEAKWLHAFKRRQNTLVGKLRQNEQSFIFPYILQTLNRKHDFISWICSNIVSLESLYKSAGCPILTYKNQEVIDPSSFLTESFLASTDKHTADFLTKVYLDTNRTQKHINFGKRT